MSDADSSPLSGAALDFTPAPPQADRRPLQTAHHGRLRQDDYAWLKPADWMATLNGKILLDEDINAYLEQENRYTQAVLEPLSGFRQALVSELRGRMQDEEIDLPEQDGPFEYYWCYAQGSEYPCFVRRPVGGRNKELMLDGELEARGCDYFEFGDFEVSPDHYTLAWSADYWGSERARLRFRNLVTGEDLDSVVDDVSSVTWVNSECVLYTRINAEHRASQVYRHCPRAVDQPDELLFEEKDSAFEVVVGRLRSGDYVEIVSSCDGQDEVWLVSTLGHLAPPVLFQARDPGLEYSVEHQGKQFFVHTNAGGAKDFQVMTTPVGQTNIENWTAWHRPQPDVMVLSVDAYKDWIIWMEQRDTLTTICIQDKSGNRSRIVFDEVAYELDYDLSPEFDSNSLRYTYESPTTAPQIWQLDLQNGERTLLKETVIPSGHDPADYRMKRITATSADGTLVPLTCLYHSTTPLDGTSTCVLEGYGSYGSSMLADFDSHRLSLVDRGMVYALAHVRGGQECGRGWYDAAKGRHKQNTMYDFIACAETLVRHEFCRSGGAVALGRSAGGLLVGAVANQAPQLFAGVVADVPFVDVLATLLDASHPLTPGEWGQWGNPLESPQAYDWIAAYSPYDNIVKQAYPAMLVTTALADQRVGYWEAAKWVARLRKFDQGGKPILLHTKLYAGHGGVSGRFESLSEVAREIAFIAVVGGVVTDC